MPMCWWFRGTLLAPLLTITSRDHLAHKTKSGRSSYLRQLSPGRKYVEGPGRYVGARTRYSGCVHYTYHLQGSSAEIGGELGGPFE
jgi:hypothetical protein